MEINYVIKKSIRKSISVQVQQDGTVFVKAPVFMPVSEIEKYIISKKSWITKRLAKLQQEKEALERLGFFTSEQINQIKKEAKKIIPERVKYYAEKSGISYNKIFIRLQKSRWGSCSTDGNLNFNCLLVLMPTEILDSVVVHELCHRHHMNHSKAFYKEIYSIFPDYDKCDKWLKENGSVYLKRAGL